jgi:hypothetical protein
MLKTLWVGGCAVAVLAGCATAQAPLDVASRTATPPRQLNCLTTGTRIALKEGWIRRSRGKQLVVQQFSESFAASARLL